MTYGCSFSIKQANRELFIAKQKRFKGAPKSEYRKLSLGMKTVRFLSISSKGVTKHFPIFKQRAQDQKDIKSIFLIKDERNTRKFEGFNHDEEAP